MILKEEVEHIAKLARLELSEKEVKKMQKDLSEILDYFDLLKSASVPKGLDSGVTKKDSVLRKDEVISKHDIADKLIGQAPDKKDRSIKVKAIF
jgi:aspartyl/glutamyl-tRNA(Asn/Gln) amidotransferase C subunit